MAALIIAEHDGRHLSSATRRVVSAALLLSPRVDVLVAGRDCRSIALEAAGLAGVCRVLLADAPHYADQTAENFAALIVSHATPYSHILASASVFGKNVLPRVAAMLDVEQISEICRVVSADTFVRPIYAGNALVTVQSSAEKKVLTVRATAFSAVCGGACAVIEDVSPATALSLAEVLCREMAVSGRAELGLARIVVAGGRGLGGAENFRNLLTPLADRLGAAIGASYGAVSAGYAGNELQVGQTGKIIAPDLYIAIGISGAIQHLAGIKDARVIVAINRDPEAPIFKVADYGLVGDLFESVPALVDALDPL